MCAFLAKLFFRRRVNRPCHVWGADAELHTSSQLSCLGPQMVSRGP